MNVSIGDIIETKVGGPYKVINVIDNLVIFEMKGGIGQTITEYVTKITKPDLTFKQKSKWTKVNKQQ